MRQRTMFSARFAVAAVIVLIAFFAPVRLALPQSSLSFAQTKLIAADAAPHDYFGLSVAPAGDTVLVGAYGKSDLATAAGAAYAFTRQAATWTQQARLGTADAPAGAYFGAAIATNGTQTAVGAPYASIGAQDAGAVYLFSNADWRRQAIITPDDPESVAQFGGALAIGQNTLIVGAPLHDSYGRDAGAVYVFAFDGIAWVQRQKLIGADTVPGDRFGSALALSGGWLAVSAPQHGAGGAVYLFTLDGGAWVQRHKVSAGDTIAGDRFGSALALSDGWLAAGAPLHRASGSFSGAVYLFEFNSVAWVQRQKLVASDTVANDSFGSALALSSQRLIVGAPLHSANGPASGAVYVFDRNGATWVERAKLIGSDTDSGDRLGWSVGIDGNMIVAGAYGDALFGPATGAAYVFVDVTGSGATNTPLLTVTATPTDTPVPTNTPTATATSSNTPTATAAPSMTPSHTPTATATSTPSVTPSNTPTATASMTPSTTPSSTPSNTPTATATLSATPSPTNTPTATPSHTPTATATPTPSSTLSNTPTATATPSATPIPTNTATPSPAATVTPGAVRPILACVARRSAASYVALFGYDMQGEAAVQVPIGSLNRFNRYREDLGQPTTFEPGTRRVAFAVVFDGLPLTWSLNGQKVTAHADYPIRCSSDVVLRIQPIVECTRLDGTGEMVVRFGYRNDNAFNVAVPVWRQNFFVPQPIRRGQPIVFAPGRHHNVFEVCSSERVLVWLLDGRIAVATDSPVLACRFN